MSLAATFGVAAVLAGVAIPAVQPPTASAQMSWCQVLRGAKRGAIARSDWTAVAYWEGLIDVGGCYR
jgi:hypothetical protein